MFGYAKIHSQIFDSSIAEDWQVRHVFEDLLILSNSDGVVDMTHEAIARRTNVPLEIVTRAITELEKPDPKSRSDVESGARIKRLDEHRNWGWWIINHAIYRDMTTDDQYREKTRQRVRRFRQNAKEKTNVTHVTLPVTHVTTSRSSKQKQKQKQIADANAGELIPNTCPSDPFGNPIPKNLQTEAFLAALILWYQHKKERREGYKPTGAKALLTKLENMGEPDFVVECIKSSISSNWAGIYPPKENAYGKTNTIAGQNGNGGNRVQPDYSKGF